MRKNPRKVDIIIIAVILLMIVGGILAAVLTQNAQQDAGKTVSADSDGNGKITGEDYNGKTLGIMTGSAFEPITHE